MTEHPLNATRYAEQRLETALAKIVSSMAENRGIFTRVYAEEARLAATASDRRISEGRSLGPLDGRIISIKDLFDVPGETTMAGSIVLRARPPATRLALSVARLRAAGAIIVGKTLMTEFAFSAVGLNPHYGDPGNPRDRTRIAGGSSTGAAISVLDEMAEIAIGSDTGGSVRIPAAISGLVGFKPSSGRIPRDGAFPLSPTLDAIGPLGRNVADCACADAVMADADPDPLPAIALDTQSLTIARGRLFSEIEGPVERAFERAIAALRSAGAQAREGSLEAELTELAELDRIGVFTATELRAVLAAEGIENLGEIDANIRTRIEAADRVSAADYVKMTKIRSILLQRVDDRLASGEILVLPTVPITAPTIDSVRADSVYHHVNMLLLRNPRVANLFDLPAISLPLMTENLPVGLMLMGRHGTDRHLLAVAAAAERVLARAI